MLTKIQIANQCFLTSYIVSVVKKEKQNNKKQTKNNNKLKLGTIVPTMNHYPRNEQEGDPEFSTR